MRLKDQASLGRTRRTSDGYLATEAFAVRTGVQLYRGDEVDRENKHGMRDRAIVRVYRPESEVRRPASLQTFSHAPVTVGHPSEAVDSHNWADLAVGEVSTEAEWEDNKIRLPLVLKDAAAIALVEAGVRELSAGYTCDLEFVTGTTPKGETYDAVQRNIRINHLAIVPKGRAGADCSIQLDADSSDWGPTPLTQTGDNMTTKPVVLGDRAVHVAADDAQAVEQFRDAAKAAQVAADQSAATKDAEIRELKAQLAAFDGKSALSDAEIEARVEARAALVGKAGQVDSTIATAGVSDADIQRACCIKHYGEDAIKDKSADYIATAFDLIKTDDAPPRKVADTVIVQKQPPSHQVKDAGEDAGYTAYIQRMQDAWKQPAKET